MGSVVWRKTLISQHHTGDANALNSAVASESRASDSELGSKELLALVEHRLDEEKAEQVLTIDLEGKSDVADALVIASGRSQRHVAALADKISRSLKESGLEGVKIEGLPSADWVLLDAGDLIVHLFRPEVREFYNLERIWAPERVSPAAE